MRWGLLAVCVPAALGRGNAGLGAAAGAGADVLGAFLYDRYEQSKANAYQQGYQAGSQSH